MKTRNMKGSGTSVTEEEIGLKTPAKNAEDAQGVKSVGVLTRSQKKRLSEVGARTPRSTTLMESRQSSVRKKRTALERTENEEQNFSTQGNSIPSKRRSTRIQHSVQQEVEDKQSEKHRRQDSVKKKPKDSSENINEDGNCAKRELFHSPSPTKIDIKVSSVETSESDSSKSKSLSDIEEIEGKEYERREVIADLDKSSYNEYKCIESDKMGKNIANLNESLGNKQNKSLIKNEARTQKEGSEGSIPRKKLRTSEIENVEANTMKETEDSLLVKNKCSDSDDGSVLASSQITDTSDATRASENTELTSQSPQKIRKPVIKEHDMTSKLTENSEESDSLQETASPLKSEDKNDSQSEINKKKSSLKSKTTDISLKSSSLTEDGSSMESLLTENSEIKGNSAEHSSNVPFKEPKLDVSKSSLDTSQFISKKSKYSDESKSFIDTVLSARKQFKTFIPVKKSPISPSTFEQRKSISSKEEANETSDSDSDAESRKAIMESAHKRIIQNISTSESESRKTVPPIKTLQKLKISSDSDSAPESLSFNVARQQAKDSLKHAVESIQREKKRRKEKRRQRLEKYKQQKEEKLIRLKEKRASQEDASCSSSEESAYEEDEAVIASISKSNKSPTITKEKENIDDLLPSKRRKTDSISVKPEEKISIKDNKNDLPEDQEQQPCIGKLKKLADEILENLPDTVPVYSRKTDEKISSQPKKNKTERHKNSKAHKGLDGVRGMQDVDYIPLNTYGATQFGAVPLNKMIRAPKSMAQQAAEFRQQMLYGSHIKRVSGNASTVYQQKLKASGKDRLVR